MRAGPVIRAAAARDRGPAVATLARAFWDDPFIVHFFPDEAIRARRIGRFFDLLWRANTAVGRVDVAGAGEAVALWRPPGRWRVSRWTMLGHLPRMVAAYGVAIGRVLACLRAMERQHPIEAHWYLMTLGTAPEAQGRGLGGAVVRAGLARCDVDGLPAYLECGSAANIPFYEGLGFRLLGEVEVPGGPAFYPMWRAPSAAGSGREQRL